MDFQRLQVPRAPKSVAETAKDKESTYWRSYKVRVLPVGCASTAREQQVKISGER